MSLVQQHFSRQEIIRATTLVASSGIAAKGIVALRSLYLLNSITVYEYGVFRLILSLLSIFQIFMLSGLDGVIENEIAIAIREGRRARAAAIFCEFVVLHLTLALIIWVAFFCVVSFLVGQYYDAGTIAMLQVASTIILLTAVGDIFSTLFAATAAMGIVAKTAVVFEGINLALLYLFFLFQGPSVNSLLMSIIAFRLVTVAVCWRLAAEDVRGWWAEARLGRPFLVFSIVRTYGKWAVLSNLGSELLSDGRDFIIKYVFSTEAVGLYNFAKGLISQFGNILPLKRIGYAFGPYKITRENIRADYFAHGVKIATIASFGIMVISGLGGTFLVQVLLPKYAQALPLFYIMLVAGLFGSVAFMTDVYMVVLR